jgi:stringent starvation protein B
MSASSTKPYLLRAIHEWCADNGYTPYLAVAVDENTEVPREHVRNGEIVLNISITATHKLVLGNEKVEFQARFGGVARSISVPVENVTAIYARETGHGMAFDVPKAPAIVEPPPVGDASRDAAQEPGEAPGPENKAPALSAVPPPSEAQAGGSAPSPESPPSSAPPPGRPKLTIIK